MRCQGTESALQADWPGSLPGCSTYFGGSYVKANSKVKNEDIFAKFSPTKIEPTELGRQQFFDHESRGVKPDQPDPYYTSLRCGKMAMDWTSEQLRMGYFCEPEIDLDGKLHPPPEWYGWIDLWEQWKGELHILKMVTKWAEYVAPKWLYNEDWYDNNHDRKT